MKICNTSAHKTNSLAAGGTNELRNSQLTALIEEYKEMRNEIRSLYGQYFSIVFGVILTGIFVTSYNAFEGKEYLFPVIPPMIVGWFSLTIIMRVNVQHIARYIGNIEVNINNLIGYKSFSYETTYAKKLWFSWTIKFIASVPVILISIIYILSLYRSFFYIQSCHIIIFGICINNFAHYYVYCFSIALIVTLMLLVVLPERIFKRNR